VKRVGGGVGSVERGKESESGEGEYPVKRGSLLMEEEGDGAPETHFETGEDSLQEESLYARGAPLVPEGGGRP